MPRPTTTCTPSRCAIRSECCLRLTSYLRDPAYVEANGAARVKALGDRRIPTTAIIVQTLADDWLIELEIIAMA